MIYIYYLDYAFEDIAYALQEALTYHNIDSVLITNISKDLLNSDLYIILGINNSLVKLPSKYIAYQFEQTGNEKSWFTSTYINKLRGAIEIWDYSIKNMQNCKQYNLQNIEYVPLGYSDRLDKKIINVDKEYDVLFYGSSCLRRDKLMDKLKNLGIKTYYSTYKLWSEERDLLISKSKIVLNIHFYENPILETSRLSYLINNKSFVISERSLDPILDHQYKNYLVFSDYDEIPDKCLYYLKNPDKMTDIANKGYEKFKTKKYYDQIPLDTIFKHINSNTNNSNNNSNNDNDNSNRYSEYKFREADIEYMNDGSIKLKIDKVMSDDVLPKITLITPTHNRSWALKLGKRNFYSFIYPSDKLEWIILESDPIETFESDDNRIKYEQVSNKLSLWEKRNMCVQKSTGDIIIHMDDDDYYLPESILAKVKILDKYNLDCVGCTTIGIYHLIDNYSYIMNTKYLSEASMAYKKSFWLEREFSDKNLEMGEGYSFIKGRENKCITLPFYLNLIAFTHNDNYTEKLRTHDIDKNCNDNFFNNWDIQTQWFILKLRSEALRK